MFTDFDREFIMRPIGEGAIPWDNILQRLNADGYTGFITLEPHSERSLRRQAWQQTVDYIRSKLGLASFQESRGMNAAPNQSVQVSDVKLVP
jgi:hypothetical protein